MVDLVGKSGTGGVNVSRVQVNGGAPLAKAEPTVSAAGQATVSSMVFDMIRSGPPVDFGKVAKLKEAISQGNYPINPAKIAERMIALDLPREAD